MLSESQIKFITIVILQKILELTKMNDKSTLPLYFFLFCQLIQQCYKNHKQQDYLTYLKQAGHNMGYKLYNLICIRKQITERPNSLPTLIKNIQTKVFKFLFNYQAFNTYTASSQQNVQAKEYYHVIQDNVSVYLTWMPEHLWVSSCFFSGVIQAICECSGLKCEVISVVRMENTENPLTEFQIKISEQEMNRWKQYE